MALLDTKAGRGREGSAEGPWPCTCTRTTRTPELGGARKGLQRGRGPVQVHQDHLDTRAGRGQEDLHRGCGPAHVHLDFGLLASRIYLCGFNSSSLCYSVIAKTRSFAKI